ncbi:MAG: polyamine aminopropyltransferase [Polaromonas sp.]
MTDKAAKAWLNEVLDEGFGYAILSSQLLCQRQSSYQLIEVHDTPSFGHLLRIDGSFMASEKDEFFYHENLVHVPACTHPQPESALIIGGGDGGSAEELLKHNTITSVKLVEIDPVVLDVSRTYLRAIHHGALDETGGDPRLEIFVADGLEYMRSSQTRYDLIVLDLTDPGGPSKPLYTADFYRHCAARLNPGGLLSLQVASPFAQPERVVSVLTELSQAFSIVRPYLVTIPLSGGQWMMACASQTLDPADVGAAHADAVIAKRGLKLLQHYNGHTHQAAMALPNFVRQLIAPTSARQV